MFTLLKRIIKAGFTNFQRQSSLSTATVFILVITTVLISSLFLAQYITRAVISNLQEKVDISVYFKEEVSEKEILEVKGELFKIPEVKDVEYISKEQALQNFVEMNKDNPRIMEGLETVGVNPLLAALNIRAREAAQYENIFGFLEKSPFKSLIDHANYPQKKLVIQRLFSITSNVNKAGIILSIILASVAVLVAFNTIRIAIYNSKEEISIMKLVGASNWFIRGPFIIQGIICGILSTLIAFSTFTGICYFLGPKLEILSPGLDVFNYFTANFITIFLIQLTVGTGMGVLSSIIAIRKYLEV